MLIKYKEDISTYKYKQLLHRENLIAQGTTKYKQYIPYVEVYADTKRKSKDDIALLFVYRGIDYRIAEGETNYTIINSWQELSNYLERLSVVLTYVNGRELLNQYLQ